METSSYALEVKENNGIVTTTYFAAVDNETTDLRNLIVQNVILDDSDIKKPLIKKVKTGFELTLTPKVEKGDLIEFAFEYRDFPNVDTKSKDVEQAIYTLQSSAILAKGSSYCKNLNSIGLCCVNRWNQIQSLRSDRLHSFKSVVSCRNLVTKHTTGSNTIKLSLTAAL